MRVITGRHRPGLGMGMKLPFQHYKNDEDEEDNKNNSGEEEKHDNRGTEDEESSSGVYNVLYLSNSFKCRGDGGALGHGAHWDICIFGSFVVYQKRESLGWRASDITYHLL